MNKELMFSSKYSEWETPNDIFKMLDMEFNFGVDLAANIGNSKCKHFIAPSENALLVDWSLPFFKDKYLWLNPPYGKEIKDWIKKCDESAEQGVKIVALLPARTDTKWFHNYIYRKYEVRFLKGRIKFLKDGMPQDAAPFPSMIVIFEKK